MKFFLLSITLAFAFSFTAQEIVKESKAKHSFNIAGGLFTQASQDEYKGWTASLGYQVQFPNRFVLGVYGLKEKSSYMSAESGNPDKELWSKIDATSGGIHLGVHLIRKKRFDLSVLVASHFNYQKSTTKRHNKITDEYTKNSYYITYLFTPILAYRIQSFYRLGSWHGLGLIVDLNYEFEWDGFGDVITSYGAFVGRLMLSYRITIPSR